MERVKKKTKYVEVEYWDCGEESHSHRSERVAQVCFNGSQTKRVYMPEQMRLGRKIYVAREVIKGRTYDSLSKELKISNGSLRVYVEKVFRISRHPKLELNHDPEGGCGLDEMRLYKAQNLYLISGVAKYWCVPEEGIAFKGSARPATV